MTKIILNSISIIWLLSLLIHGISCTSQETQLTKPEEIDEKHVCIKPVETAPEYICGGNTRLLEIIYENLKYPKELCLSGVSLITLLVDSTGNVSDFTIRRSFHPAIDTQIINLVKNKEFIPGTLNGKNWNFQLTLPIRIQLN